VSTVATSSHRRPPAVVTSSDINQSNQLKTCCEGYKPELRKYSHSSMIDHKIAIRAPQNFVYKLELDEPSSVFSFHPLRKMLRFVIITTILCAVNAQRVDWRCPTPPRHNPPVHLPDPDDCTRFMTCVGQSSHPTNCPPGQHWSVSANACDWPE
jgi:hypothetical protein